MTRTNSRPLAALLLALCLLPAGCGESEVNGPPPTKLGHDPCAECDMIVNEDRYAAGAVVKKDGHAEHQSFDDTGCMLDHAREHPELVFTQWFVRDAKTRQWLPAASAHFVMSEQIHTPMGSGIAAYSSNAEASEAARQFAGLVIDWSALPAARQKFMEDRYGKK